MREEVVVQRTSRLTGRVHTRILPLNPNAFHQWQRTPFDRRLSVDEAFPQLSEEDRDFLKTGITKDEMGLVF